MVNITSSSFLIDPSISRQSTQLILKNKNYDEDDNVPERSARGLALPHALRPDIPQRLGVVSGLHCLGEVHLHRVSLQVISLNRTDVQTASPSGSRLSGVDTLLFPSYSSRAAGIFQGKDQREDH